MARRARAARFSPFDFAGHLAGERGSARGYAVAGTGPAPPPSTFLASFLMLCPIMSSRHSWATFSTPLRVNHLKSQLRLTSPKTVSTSVALRLRRATPSSLVSLSAALPLSS